MQAEKLAAYRERVEAEKLQQQQQLFEAARAQQSRCPPGHVPPGGSRADGFAFDAEAAR